MSLTAGPTSDAPNSPDSSKASSSRRDGQSTPDKNSASPPEGIANLLTVILTTSPTPSAPSTDLVVAVLDSFRAHCPALLACPVIVVFDTYDRIGPQLRLKRGCVTAAAAAHYDAYKASVRLLVQEAWGVGHGLDGASAPPAVETETGTAEYGSPFLVDNTVKFTISRPGGGLVAFVEPEVRLGFGLAVRTALRAATTPYVWVQQHDWTLAADVPLAAMLDVMQSSEARVQAAAGASPESDAEPESPATETSLATDLAALDAALDGPSAGLPKAVPIRYVCLPSVRMLRYAVSGHAAGYPSLRTLTAAYKKSWPTSDGTANVPLTPLFFWHDKTHIASRAHYLARIFPSRLALSRGDFIEDHIGQRARDQMKRGPAGWLRWACWLYYPDDGNRLCLRHLQGRTWRGEAEEHAARERHQERNRSAASAAAALAAAGATARGAVADAGETSPRSGEDDDAMDYDEEIWPFVDQTADGM